MKRHCLIALRCHSINSRRKMSQQPWEYLDSTFLNFFQWLLEFNFLTKKQWTVSEAQFIWKLCHDCHFFLRVFVLFFMILIYNALILTFNCYMWKICKSQYFEFFRIMREYISFILNWIFLFSITILLSKQFFKI